jgi:hypothetical protein
MQRQRHSFRFILTPIWIFLSMRIIFSTLICVTSLSVFAQEFDFPDYRSKKENFLRMQEKAIRAEVASFTMGGMEESVGKGTLFNVPPTSFGNDFITFSNENVKVTIKAGVFDPAKHKLQYYAKEHLVRIDGKPYFGTYGEVPKTTIESITVIVDKDTIAIPATAYADLYEPDFTYRDKSGATKSYNKVLLSSETKNGPRGERMYIYMLNRDPQGSYEVTWVIENKKYLRRVIDFGFLKAD